MKKHLRMIAAMLLSAAAACSQTVPEKEYYLFTSFHEPADEGLRLLYSSDGVRWDSLSGTWLKPELGQCIMRDPSILRDKSGTFHLVWTIAWKGDTGFGYARSKDLVHWSEQRRIGVMDSVPSTQNVWAPELFYDDENDRYMIVYASCVKDAGFDCGIEDPANNHRLYCVTTRDFETFSDPQLFYDPGFSCIDAMFVKRGDHDYVMVFKDNTRPNRNLRVAFAQHAAGPYGAASEPFTEAFCEGPSTILAGEDYYIYFDAYRKFIYGAVKTRDFKTFEDATSEIRIPRGHKHGTLCRVPASVVAPLISGEREPLNAQKNEKQ